MVFIVKLKVLSRFRNRKDKHLSQAAKAFIEEARE
jgi:hypothetical protein